MIGLQRSLRLVRRVLLLFVVGLASYGVLRFDVVRLPEGALSPLYGIQAGDRLLVDVFRRRPELDEVVLYRGSAGELLLGRAAPAPQGISTRDREALRSGALWILADRAGGPAPDSDELGPIPERDLVGRVVLVLPW